MPSDVLRRIAIFGPSGSGKTTLSKRIGERLHLPVIELDALFHGPNWTPTPPDEFRAKVLNALGTHTEGWVCDGNYSIVRDLLLPKVDTIVWLRLPFRVVYWRLVRRTIRGLITREPLAGDNRESLRITFASRQSILLWGITNWKQHIRKITQTLDVIDHDVTVIELRTAQEVEEFISQLAYEYQLSR